MSHDPQLIHRSRLAPMLVAVLAALALIATACGSSASTASASAVEVADDDVAATDQTTEPEDVEAADRAPSTTEDVEVDQSDPFESPINDLLGVDFDAFQNMNFEAMAVQGELEMQRCMEEQGFEYTPVDHSADFADGGLMFQTDPDIEIGSRRYAETYGLGISTLVDQQMEQEMRLAVRASETVDPNPAYRASLSEAAQKAYDLALEGPEGGMGMAPGGCTAEVLEAVDMGAFIRFGAFMVEFPDYGADIATRVEADPQVVALADEYARCMADQGYSFANETEVYTTIFAEWNPLRQEIFGDAMPFDFGAAEPDEGEANEPVVVPETENQAPEITAEQRVKIDALAEREITLATLSWDCRQGHDDVRTQVRIGFEQQFIEENQAAITAFLEAQGG